MVYKYLIEMSSELEFELKKYCACNRTKLKNVILEAIMNEIGFETPLQNSKDFVPGGGAESVLIKKNLEKEGWK